MCDKEEVKFGDICREVKLTTKDPITDGYERYVGLEHMDSGSLKLKRWGIISEDKPSFTRVFRKGNILFGKRRPYLKKAAIADFDGVCSGDIIVIEPSQKLSVPEVLPFIVQSEEFWQWAIKTSSGSLSPRTKFKSLAEFSLKISNDQEKLKSASTILNHTVANIALKEDLIHQSELLMQVLIIEKLFKGTPGKYRKLGDISRIIDPNPSHRYPESVKNGVPLLSTENFDGIDGFSLEDCKNVDEGIYEEQENRCQYSEYDIVFARKGRIGFSRFYGKGKKCFSHTIALIKPDPKIVLPEYLLWTLRSTKTIRNIENRMNSNSGVPTLGLKHLSEVEIPVLHFSDQIELVKSLNALNNIRNQAQSSKAYSNDIVKEITRRL